MKSLSHKLLAIIFSVALFTGCASVTDPGLNTQKQPTNQTEQVDNPDFGSEQEMSPIVDEPEL
jgi:PBP1b-binding outer membrane lipoprotein LpoB